jgi:mono/diheme cytochrome c family protein
MSARLAVALLLLLGLGSCAPVLRGVPAPGPIETTDPVVVEGERLFAAACHACHPNALAGLGPGIVDRPLPRWLVRLQVRVGVGAMPAFSREELTDAELDALLDYLDARRRQ